MSRHVQQCSISKLNFTHHRLSQTKCLFAVFFEMHQKKVLRSSAQSTVGRFQPEDRTTNYKMAHTIGSHCWLLFIQFCSAQNCRLGTGLFDSICVSVSFLPTRPACSMNFFFFCKCFAHNWNDLGAQSVSGIYYVVCLTLDFGISGNIHNRWSERATLERLTNLQLIVDALMKV